MNQDFLFEVARDAGLPISWWEKAKQEGETREWRELQLFAELIVRECVDILDPNGAYAEKYKHAHVPGPDGSRTPLTSKEFENMQSAQKLREHFGV